MRNDRMPSAGRTRIVNSSTPRPPSSACNAHRVAPTRLWGTLCASAPPYDVRVLTTWPSGQKLLMEATARADYAPEGTDARPSLFATVKRTFTEFSEDNMTDWAAALTYYGLLSLFPALIALVSIIGLVGDPATITRQVTDIVTSLGPKSAADTFAGPIKSITANKSAAGILLVVSIATALWSASGYVGAFMRASNVIYETPEGRPIWKLRPLQILVTLTMILLIAIIALALVLSGPLVKIVADPLGIGTTAQDVWNYGKWPVLVLLVITMFSVLYYAA